MTTRISAAESQIMEALWAAGPQGADEIVAVVGPANSWGEATVKTLINRLLKKKALVSEREAGKVRYRPLVARTDYITGESQGRGNSGIFMQSYYELQVLDCYNNKT